MNTRNDKSHWTVISTLTLVVVWLSASSSYAERHPPKPTGESVEQLNQVDVTAVEARIHEQLGKGINLHVKEMALKDMLDVIKRSHQIEVLIDQKALSDAGTISPDTPVTIDVNGIPLRNALRLLLGNLNLTYTVQNGVLLITTKEAAIEHMQRHVYNLAGIVTTTPTGNAEVFKKLLEETVSPETWNTVGGRSSIEYFRMPTQPVFVISTTQEAHDEIAELLAALRKQETDGAKGDIKLPAATSEEDPLHPHVSTKMPLTTPSSPAKKGTPSTDKTKFPDKF